MILTRKRLVFQMRLSFSDLRRYSNRTSFPSLVFHFPPLCTDFVHFRSPCSYSIADTDHPRWGSRLQRLTLEMLPVPHYTLSDRINILRISSPLSSRLYFWACPRLSVFPRPPGRRRLWFFLRQQKRTSWQRLRGEPKTQEKGRKPKYEGVSRKRHLLETKLKQTSHRAKK
jgi:hypothetical protein